MNKIRVNKKFIEENIKTLFMGLVNPNDKEHYEKIPSFQDRIIQVQVPYILDYNTEVAIYKKRFGSKIEKYFLPGVLENLAKIIISTRLVKINMSWPMSAYIQWKLYQITCICKYINMNKKFILTLITNT